MRINYHVQYRSLTTGRKLPETILETQSILARDVTTAAEIFNRVYNSNKDKQIISIISPEDRQVKQETLNKLVRTLSS